MDQCVLHSLPGTANFRPILRYTMKYSTTLLRKSIQCPSWFRRYDVLFMQSIFVCINPSYHGVMWHEQWRPSQCRMLVHWHSWSRHPFRDLNVSPLCNNSTQTLNHACKVVAVFWKQTRHPSIIVENAGWSKEVNSTKLSKVVLNRTKDYQLHYIYFQFKVSSKHHSITVGVKFSVRDLRCDVHS